MSQRHSFLAPHFLAQEGEEGQNEAQSISVEYEGEIGQNQGLRLGLLRWEIGVDNA